MSTDLVTPESADIDRFIDDFPFKSYRNYRVLSRAKQGAVMRTEIDNALKNPDAQVLGIREGGALQTAAVFHRLPWDSTFFDLPMARISHLLRAPGASRASLAAAVAESVAYARSIGVKHIAARADIADTAAIGALEEHGFRLMDALATYIYHPKLEAPGPAKEMGVLRMFRPEDTEQVIDITREAYKGFRGRFHLDPHLPDDRCDAMYLEWARRACLFELADVVLVTEDGHGELHGFTCYRQIEPVSTAGGVVMCGNGIGGCRRRRPGAYMGLIREATEQIHARGAVTECQTQNYNFPTVRIYEALGIHYVRADYTFHAWLA
jgi:hypothetical protein